MKENITDMGNTQIYELGYHLLPIVAEEDVYREVSQIHSLILDNRGSVIAEATPLMRPLSYDIPKKVETKNLKFNKAYFGWIKFETDGSQILNLKNKIEALPNILRFIIIKTVRENTLHTLKAPMFKRENNKENKSEVSLETVEKTPTSEAEIDKSIDALIIEN